jgi:hypothetical protein
MNYDAANGPICNWVIVTQLRGEEHCSLRLGHSGDHCFAAHLQVVCSLDAPGRTNALEPESVREV